jgi:hypothetical protein
MTTTSLKTGNRRTTASRVLECGGPPLLSGPPAALSGVPSDQGLAHPQAWRLIGSLFCALASAYCFPAWGQYSVDWFTMDGGGGTSTGGVYTVSGAIGQPDAGAMTGGNYTLVGGFWGVIAAVQTPGAPYLWVTLTTTNTVCVWWALSETSWQLQATTNLITTGSVWTEYSYQTNGASCCRIESAPTGTKFYRLKQP